MFRRLTNGRAAHSGKSQQNPRDQIQFEPIATSNDMDFEMSMQLYCPWTLSLDMTITCATIWSTTSIYPPSGRSSLSKLVKKELALPEYIELVRMWRGIL